MQTALRLALVIGIAAGAAPGCGLNYPDTFHPPWPAPNIQLKSGAVPYALEEDRAKHRHRVTLVFFGFTHCPDVCPAAMHKIGEAMKELKAEERAKLRVVFISVDPARDTPEIARNYGQKFHPDIIGLSGTRAQIDEVIKAYRVFAEGKEGQITHASGVYWINSEGGVSKILAQDFKQDKLLHDLRITLADVP